MINIKEQPWELCLIDNPTEEQCLISVKANRCHIFMVKNLTPKLIKLVDPLYIQLWYDLRVLGFDYHLELKNDKYKLYLTNIGKFSLFDYKTNKRIIYYLTIDEFYPLFKDFFKQELRANKLTQLKSNAVAPNEKTISNIN